MEVKKMNIKESLTFDDVLLIPQYSDIIPSDIDVSTVLSNKIKLNIPILSAAMDTVTEANLAIALALQGGLGIIHKNLNPELQAQHVKRVKRYESGIIADPITLNENDTIKKAFDIMMEFNVNGIPVIDSNGYLKGMLTHRDLRYYNDINALISSVMTPFDKLVTGKHNLSLKEAETLICKNKIEKLPLIDDNKKLKGLITYKDVQKNIDFPYAAKDLHNRLLAGAAVGVGDDARKRVPLLIENNVDVIVVDTAHGHSKNVGDTIKWIKSNYDVTVVGGNVATGDGAKFLSDSGADIVKVGVGPGSICTTRIVAGIGVPQLTAVEDAKKAVLNYNTTVISDGGIRYSGDIVKALAAGADAVMLGNLFAQTQEAPGEVIQLQGKTYKSYRGMGSIDAMKLGSKDRYGQGGISDDKLVPEGIVGTVPYRGQVKDICYQMVGGLKSGMGYCGSQNLKQLKEKAIFVKLTHSSQKESHPHDIFITKEAPNYWQ